MKLGRGTLKQHINSLRKYYKDKQETETSSCGTVNIVIYESDEDGEFGRDRQVAWAAAIK